MSKTENIHIAVKNQNSFKLSKFEASISVKNSESFKLVSVGIKVRINNILSFLKDISSNITSDEIYLSDDNYNKFKRIAEDAITDKETKKNVLKSIDENSTETKKGKFIKYSLFVAILMFFLNLSDFTSNVTQTMLNIKQFFEKNKEEIIINISVPDNDYINQSYFDRLDILEELIQQVLPQATNTEETTIQQEDYTETDYPENNN